MNRNFTHQKNTEKNLKILHSQNTHIFNLELKLRNFPMKNSKRKKYNFF
jgi:hypothetical protein